MQRHVVTVPPDMMRMLTVDWDIDWRGQSLGETNTGATQTVYNAFPRWIGSPKLVLGPDVLGQWRAIRWQAQGRVGIYRLPMNDPGLFRRTSVAPDAQVLANGVPFATGQRFASGLGFLFDPFVPAAAAAAAGATSLTVEVDDPAWLPVVGQIMSHDDWPFGVVAVVPLTGTNVRLDVQPPLRAPVDAGGPVFLQGTGLFEATDERAGNPEYGLVAVSRPQLSFREVLNR